MGGGERRRRGSCLPGLLSAGNRHAGVKSHKQQTLIEKALFGEVAGERNLVGQGHP